MKEIGRYEVMTHHEMKMLQATSPPGLLPVTIYQQDDYLYLTYEPQMFRKFESFTTHGSIPSSEMLTFFRGIAEAIHSCYVYLLEPGRLRLELDQLYQDRDGQLYVVYCPSDEGNEGSFEEHMEELILQLLNLSIDNEVIIDHLHQLHRSLLSRQLSVTEIGDLIHSMIGGWL